MDPTYRTSYPPAMSGANPEATDPQHRSKSRKSSKSTSVKSSSKKQQPPSPIKDRSRSEGGGGGKLLGKVSKLTGWLSTSEPSTQALLSHQKEAFRKAGIPLTDSEAHSKLRAPIGEIPSDAITSTTGPDPEELLRRRKEERRRKERRGSELTAGGSIRSGGSVGSGSLSGYSMSGGSGSFRKGEVSGLSPVGGDGGQQQVPWNYGGMTNGSEGEVFSRG
ncbi:hypothetical protein QC762_113295 [Podospora pseudocomata]|uniref:Uncharacterized protein n=1 Tax=Podospora pseudocomata TaxID=2093779 RepID=A0ABR0GVQ6_9PEZI|nr:hypothetical protein QC762_113295 [Podospora pseudocomata]